MIYHEQHQVEYNECDENSRLKLSSLVDLLMRTSEHQLEKGGAGTQALLAKGLGWVVTQYHFEIRRLPRALEKVGLTTEAAGYNRFFEYRDFGVLDEKSTPLITVKSQWVVLDLSKRKLVSPDQNMMKKFRVPLLKKIPRFPRLRPQQRYDKQEEFHPVFYDLDTNHHVTNSHYFNWLTNQFERTFLQNNIPQSIDLRFDKELHLDEDLHGSLLLRGDKSYQLISSSKEEKAVCEMTWRQDEK